MSDDVKCPFCGEDEFDLIGLRSHFENGYCEVFNETETPMQEAVRLREHSSKKGDNDGRT